MRFFAGCLALFALTGLAACGGGDGAFVFTPVPYTVIARYCDAPVCGDKYTLSATCNWYAADQVGALIEPRHVDDFTTWAEGKGFTIILRSDSDFDVKGTPAPTYLVVGVPSGAADDALVLVQKRPGIVSAQLNGTMWIPELVPDFVKECRKTRTAGP